MSECKHAWQSFHEYLAWCPKCKCAPRADDVVSALNAHASLTEKVERFREVAETYRDELKSQQQQAGEDSWENIGAEIKRIDALLESE